MFLKKRKSKDSKLYRCAACEKIMHDPYTCKMREFYVDHEYFPEIDDIDVFRIDRAETVRVRLCPECFRGLSGLARQQREKYGEIK